MKTVDADEPLDPIDEDKFASLLHDAIGADVAVEIHSMNAWRMTAQIASGYRSGRVFLVGDAAHRFPPTGGIGMNTGFQDAHNLIWKIGMVEAGVAEALFDTYEPERKPVAETNSEQSLNNAMKMMEVAVQLDVDGDQRVSAADLEAVLADPDRRAGVQAAVDAQAAHFNMGGLDLGVSYTGAAVIEDGPAPATEVSRYRPSTVPGVRMPHAPLLRDGEPVSTLDLVPYDRFLVLAQSDGHGLAAAATALVEMGMPVRMEVVAPSAAVIPADDQFAGLFPAEQVLLVRPDGHIAARFDIGAAAERLEFALRELCPGLI